jgi:protein arginine kinase
MTERVELPSFLLERTPWERQTNPFWPASSFILRRNLERSLFPSKIAESDAFPLLESLKNALFAVKEIDQPLFLKSSELSALDKEYLFEHFLCLEGFPDRSNGQAFLIDRSTQFLALLNIQNHLQLHLIDLNGEWEKSWNRLSQIESSIGAAINYAFNSKFGYLTSDPACSGTGLIVHCYLHLPGLIRTGKIQGALVKQREEDLFTTGMDGSSEEFIGDIVVLSNRYTLGLTEEAILHSLHLNAIKLMAGEKTLRRELQQEGPSEIKDLISRAYGLIHHSYQLETKETLGALSLIKLGIDLNWVGGVNDGKINEMLFKCRRAHLAHLFQEKGLDFKDLAKKRAEFIHDQLKTIELKI